ncbi:MAG: family intrarane metalloprotease [Microbacteriaceae bacterium]|nr:family intrarane metalloprotease [Microbacteriaceae bacterium]
MGAIDVPFIPVPLVGLGLVLFADRATFDPRIVWRRWWVSALTLATVVIVVGALVAWRAGQTGIVFASFMPSWLPRTRPVVILFCVLLALTNSIFEETLWRFLIFDMARRFLSKGVSVVAVSIAFGLSHFGAIPGGIDGILLTALFSLMSFGLIAAAKSSLVPSIVTHCAADTLVLLLLARIF